MRPYLKTQWEKNTLLSLFKGMTSALPFCPREEETVSEALSSGSHSIQDEASLGLLLFVPAMAISDRPRRESMSPSEFPPA